MRNWSCSSKLIRCCCQMSTCQSFQRLAINRCILNLISWLWCRANSSRVLICRSFCNFKNYHLLIRRKGQSLANRLQSNQVFWIWFRYCSRLDGQRKSGKLIRKLALVMRIKTIRLWKLSLRTGTSWKELLSWWPLGWWSRQNNRSSAKQSRKLCSSKYPQHSLAMNFRSESLCLLSLIFPKVLKFTKDWCWKLQLRIYWSWALSNQNYDHK